MNHYTQIINVYNATKKLWNATNRITSIPEQGYNALVGIEQAGKKLMDNAYRYGISASDSATFRNRIESLADSFSANVYKDLDIAKASAGPMRELRDALNNYFPKEVPAQNNPVKTPATNTVQLSDVVINAPLNEKPGAAQSGRPIPDVKVEQPTPTPSIKETPKDILLKLFGRDIINFYSIPKWQYEDNKLSFDKAGLIYIQGLGIVPRTQVSIAQRIMSEGNWTKDPNYGWLNPKEYSELKSKGLVS